MQRIGPRQSLIEQAPHDWIGACARIFDNPGTIDNRAGLNTDSLALSPPSVATSIPSAFGSMLVTFPAISVKRSAASAWLMRAPTSGAMR
jgi:hypothetical protein